MVSYLADKSELYVVSYLAAKSELYVVLIRPISALTRLCKFFVWFVSSKSLG